MVMIIAPDVGEGILSQQKQTPLTWPQALALREGPPLHPIKEIRTHLNSVRLTELQSCGHIEYGPTTYECTYILIHSLHVRKLRFASVIFTRKRPGLTRPVSDRRADVDPLPVPVR